MGLKQDDMKLRIGMSRQQYQHLESKGNPRLETLELISKGLNCKLMLIPIDKVNQVMALVNNEEEDKKIIDDPWNGILGDDE